MMEVAYAQVAPIVWKVSLNIWTRENTTLILLEIDEQTEADADDGVDMNDDDFFPSLNARPPSVDPVEGEKRILKSLWNSCTTFVEVNNIFHTRISRGSETPNPREKAWRSCWQLCYLLNYMYSKDFDTLNSVKNLDLCQKLCDELFEAREKTDECADSVLRVSYTLNNQLVQFMLHKYC